MNWMLESAFSSYALCIAKYFVNHRNSCEICRGFWDPGLIVPGLYNRSWCWGHFSLAGIGGRFVHLSQWCIEADSGWFMMGAQVGRVP